MITLQKKMIKAGMEYPIVSLGTPNYVDRASILRNTFPNHKYIDLKDCVLGTDAFVDIVNLLHNFTENIIVDNAQTTPVFFEALSRNIDKISNGQIVCGVNFKIQNLRIFNNILRESVKIFELPHISAKMLAKCNGLEVSCITQSVLTGNIPSLIMRETDPDTFFAEFIAELLEKDLRRISAVDDVVKMEALLKALASHIGMPIDVVEISELCKIDVLAVKQLLKVLHWFYIIYPVKPFPNSFGKHSNKYEYIYFVNTGLASNLLNIKTEEDYMFSSVRGNLAKNAVISAKLSNWYNNDDCVKPYFWNERDNHKIDLLVETRKSGIKGIKVHDTVRLHRRITDDIKYFAKVSSMPIYNFECVYPGVKNTTFEGVSFRSWQNA